MGPTSSKRRQSILISAYACNPHRGSEAGVGFHFTRAAAASGFDVCLFTRSRNASETLLALTELGLETVKVVPHDLPMWASRLKNALPGGTHIYYSLWQLTAIGKLKRLMRTGDYSAQQHLTFASDWLPSGIALAGADNLIWGPVGGASRTPIPLYRYLGVAGVAKELVKVATGFAGRISFGQIAAARAQTILCQNRDSARAFRNHSAKIRVFPNVVVEDQSSTVSERRETDTVLLVGRLLAWKGWSLAVKAIAHSEQSLHFQVIGEGAERRRMKRLARRYGVANRLSFLGPLKHSDVIAAMKTCRVLLMPSFHDAAGWVVAEALSVGTPVVTLDLGGPAEMLEAEGLRPVPHRSGSLPADIASAIERAEPLHPSDRWGPGRLEGFYASVMATLQD